MSSMSKPSVYAHRGASSACFENTMSAFKEAIRQSADGIELDIQLTADGVPVVVHDSDLYRIAGIRKRVSSLYLSELEDIKIGKKFFRNVFGHRIPTLREAITFCEVNRLAMNIELKETVSDRPESLTSIIEMADVLDRDKVHLSSFDPEILHKAKTLAPTIETALLLKRKTTNWERLEDYFFADGFHFHKRLCKEPYLKALVASGKKLRVYGMTGKEDIAVKPPTYIDGWITDYPGRFKK